MLLATATTRHKLLVGLILIISAQTVFSQENSPYSRYGLGDIVPGQSVTSRGMGGISAGYVDYDKRYDLKDRYPKAQTVNFLNPATYSKLRITSFDLGFEVDSRTLRSQQEAKKYTVSSAIISYLQLGIPLNRKHQWGLNLGLRPFTRINYKIMTGGRYRYQDNSSDSIQNLYQGSGGSYEAFAGIGKGFKNFSVGINMGYYFGSKDYSTRKAFINDSVLYHKSNYETSTSFGGLLLNAGMQYAVDLGKETRLVVGAYGNLRQTFNANRDNTIETFNYDANGATYRQDSVAITKNQSGKIEYPSNLGMGFTLQRLDKWMFGADFSSTSWTQYRFFGNPDLVRNSWMIRVGGQVTPDMYNPKSYFSRVTYRLGFNFGPDYIRADGHDLPQTGFTGGLGLPVRKNPYTNQFSYMNVSLEYGRRGNNANQIKENTFRVAVGFTLSDLWFIKRKYD